MPPRLFASQAGTHPRRTTHLGHFCRYSVRNESADSARFGRNFRWTRGRASRRGCAYIPPISQTSETPTSQTPSQPSGSPLNVSRASGRRAWFRLIRA